MVAAEWHYKCSWPSCEAQWCCPNTKWTPHPAVAGRCCVQASDTPHAYAPYKSWPLLWTAQAAVSCADTSSTTQQPVWPKLTISLQNSTHWISPRSGCRPKRGLQHQHPRYCLPTYYLPTSCPSRRLHSPMNLVSSTAHSDTTALGNSTCCRSM